MKNLKKPLSVIAMMSMFTSCELIADAISNQNGISLENPTTIATNQDIKNEIQQKNVQNTNTSWFPAINLLRILGTNVEIKANQERNQIENHFKKVKSILQTVKDELKDKINENESSIKNFDETINKIMTILNNLANATANNNIEIGATNNIGTKAAIISNKNNVNTIINEIKNIIELAKNSNIDIEQQSIDNNPITLQNNAAALNALNGGGGRELKGGANKGDGYALFNIVNQVNKWEIINKIIEATTDVKNDGYAHNENNNAGQLITGKTINGAGAKSKADIAAAIALKAMSKNGKFAGYKQNDNGGNKYTKNIQNATANAVNKTLTALDITIMNILNAEFAKIKK
ncbi:variable large family protein (plasmid) [Borrelia coriaceae]|uniref:Variable large protein n=1 Tax=Borrelia coriaceae ATCC 43381 TaxID=1408429 RepID=W5SYH9_9SPIR|nr:variable large family protein [Borrelia coriaceae]AHH11872.1 hypothetical protein BCO_0012906 [Borrelia coriaceae ATCC 43381]UPA17274.1 variable large family protein [Borrelia coriaceae]